MRGVLMGQAQLTGNQAKNGRAYGSHLGELLEVAEPPSHVHRNLTRGMFAVTELQAPEPPRDPTPSLSYDDAYQVIVNLRHIDLDIWLSDRFLAGRIFNVGRTYIADLRQQPRVLIRNPVHTVNFYMPISTLRTFSEQNEMGRFEEFAAPYTVGHDDPVMRHLTRAVLSAFARPHRASGLLLDTILDAVCIHAIQQHGTSNGTLRAGPRGLAPWQERRAKELMDEHLDVSLSDLARECGLSVGHFSRAFKNSAGLAPHQWQLGRRMKRAQALLTGSTLPIADIALKCGYSSQSHFHAAFKEVTGLSPGRWRRSTVGGITPPRED